jgi:UDP-N-acetylglucosamine acyltransferase
MATQIHSTAIVDPKAVVGDGVVIGAYAVVEADVQVGEDCWIGPHCRLGGPTSIGSGNRFEGHCSVGTPPQDLKYKGEPTRLEIGCGNTFREFVTVNRGTVGGGGVTRIGDDSLFMAYSHIAHDCQVGSRLVFDNCGTLAGHVEVADDAVIGAFSAVHQFCRVGPHAFIGGFTVVLRDALPYMRTVGGRPAKCYGPNTIGLERKGFDADRIKALKAFWRFLRSPKLNTSQALEKVREELAGQQDVDLLMEFIDSSERGVTLARG